MFEFLVNTAWSLYLLACVLVAPHRVPGVLIAMGPLMVKLGQWLSIRSDALPQRYRGLFAPLQEYCPVHATAYSRQRVRALGVSGKIGKVLGSGTIAQVHRLGATRCVKVVHPEVRRKLKANYRIIRNFCGWIAWVPGTEMLRKMLEDRKLVDGLFQQTDLNKEAKQAKLFQAHLPSIGVVVPEVLAHSTHALVMEYVPGTPFDAATPIAKLTALFKIFYTAVGKFGLVHGDLHPGNLKFLNGDRPVLLDFGIVDVVDAATRARFHTLTQYMIAMRLQDFVGFFLALATGPEVRAQRQKVLAEFGRCYGQEQAHTEQVIHALVRDPASVKRVFSARKMLDVNPAPMINIFRKHGVLLTDSALQIIMAFGLIQQYSVQLLATLSDAEYLSMVKHVVIQDDLRWTHPNLRRL